jgi:hypothetical protein
MTGKGDDCLRDNQNGCSWLKLVTHQTLRYGRRRFIFILITIIILRFANDCQNILCYEVQRFRGVQALSVLALGYSVVEMGGCLMVSHDKTSLVGLMP